MREYGFSLTRILPYKDRIVFSHILYSALVTEVLIAMDIFYEYF